MKKHKGKYQMDKKNLKITKFKKDNFDSKLKKNKKKKGFIASNFASMD